MKRLLFMLIIPLVLLSGCDTNLPTPTKDPTYITSDTIVYQHDDIHKVGIWIMPKNGNYGIPTIAILPDSEYQNVGIPIK